MRGACLIGAPYYWVSDWPVTRQLGLHSHNRNCRFCQAVEFATRLEYVLAQSVKLVLYPPLRSDCRTIVSRTYCSLEDGENQLHGRFVQTTEGDEVFPAFFAKYYRMPPEYFETLESGSGAQSDTAMFVLVVARGCRAVLCGGRVRRAVAT